MCTANTFTKIERRKFVSFRSHSWESNDYIAVSILSPYHTPSNCFAFVTSVNNVSDVGESISSERTRLRIDLCFSKDASLPLFVNETASRSFDLVFETESIEFNGDVF